MRKLPGRFDLFLFAAAASIAGVAAVFVARGFQRPLLAAGLMLAVSLAAAFAWRRRRGPDVAARRQLEIMESLDQGVADLNNDGLVTFWNDALVRLVDCSRDGAIGRTIADAVPLLTQTALPRAVADALRDR